MTSRAILPGDLQYWAGNTGPILTITNAETQHAHFANALKGKWWLAGPTTIVEDTSIQRWRALIPARIMEERKQLHEAKHGADESLGKRRKNQYLIVCMLL